MTSPATRSYSGVKRKMRSVASFATGLEKSTLVRGTSSRVSLRDRGDKVPQEAWMPTSIGHCSLDSTLLGYRIPKLSSTRMRTMLDGSTLSSTNKRSTLSASVHLPSRIGDRAGPRSMPFSSSPVTAPMALTLPVVLAPKTVTFPTAS
eukprot:2942205-Rhodomonas_salina.1